MRMVVLDGYTLNPGDLSWDDLGRHGELIVHDRTAPTEVRDRARDAEIVLTNKTVLAAETIQALPRLKYIGVLATGYNVVDVAAALRQGIVVTNVPAYGTESVAQMVFAHLLNLTQHVADHAQATRRGEWVRDFCFWNYPMIELAGLTMGLVGLGRIGRATARLARAFGMNVLAYDPAIPGSRAEGIERTTLERVFQGSDVVSLHCPLTAENKGFVNRALLNRMKPGAFLINTSRGLLINEADLLEALEAGRLGGAGLDVLSVEPPPPEHPLLRARNCFVTPHIAWATKAARQRLMNTVVQNVAAFLAGKPENVVTPNV
jgi:glycerate dehydrogenase